MIQLIDLSLITARLGLLPPEVCAHVGRVSVADDIIEGSGAPLTPAVWVYPDSTTVDGPEGLGRGRILTENVSVACLVGVDPAALEAADTSLRALRSAVGELLENWRHDRRWSPMLYVGGALDTRTENYILWVETYSTSGGNFATA